MTTAELPSSIRRQLPKLQKPPVPTRSLTRLRDRPELEVEPTAGRIAEQHEQRQVIAAMLGTLSVRRRLIVELRFGLADGRPRTLEEVARQFGLQRETIRRIEGEAIAQLKSPPRVRMAAGL
jgi:RNA polymerase primary sigma factor